METIFTVENLNDQVYEKIRNDIVTGQLIPGTRLVDLQLAERYGISRTPVRDALQKLTKEGLVVSPQKKGYYVFKATRQDIVEIFEIRVILDKAVITKLVSEMMPNNYQYYLGLLKNIEDRLNEGILKGPKEFTHYDEEFHDSIISLSNNSRLLEIYSANRIQTKAFRSMTSFSQDRIDKANKLHFELLDAIKNIDCEHAVQAVIKHVELSRKDALADIDAEDNEKNSLNRLVYKTI